MELDKVLNNENDLYANTEKDNLDNLESKSELEKPQFIEERIKPVLIEMIEKSNPTTKMITDIICFAKASNESIKKCRDAEMTTGDWENRLSGVREWITNFDIDGFLAAYLCEHTDCHIEKTYWIDFFINEINGTECNDIKSIRSCISPKILKKMDRLKKDNKKWIIPMLYNSEDDINHFAVILVKFSNDKVIFYLMDSLYNSKTRIAVKNMLFIKNTLSLLYPHDCRYEAYDVTKGQTQVYGQCGLFACAYSILFCVGMDPSWIKENVTPICAEWARIIMLEYYRFLNNNNEE